MKQLLIVEGDTNDGDYVTNIMEVTGYVKDELPVLRKVLEVVKNTKVQHGHNWPMSEYANNSPNELYEGLLTEEEIDTANDYIPYGENGIHTITSVKLLTVTDEEELI